MEKEDIRFWFLFVIIVVLILAYSFLLGARDGEIESLQASCNNYTLEAYSSNATSGGIGYLQYNEFMTSYYVQDGFYGCYFYDFGKQKIKMSCDVNKDECHLYYYNMTCGKQYEIDDYSIGKVEKLIEENCILIYEKD